MWQLQLTQTDTQAISGVAAPTDTPVAARADTPDTPVAARADTPVAAQTAMPELLFKPPSSPS